MFGDGALALGVKVEVKGSAVNGVVIATRVSVEDEAEDHDKGFELHGAIVSTTPSPRLSCCARSR